jgi:signal transduction histidine kinase
LFGSGAFLVLGLLAAALVAQRVSAPLRHLSAAAEQVGQGALGTQVEATRADPDVGRAITAFNRMSGRLATLDRAHRELAARQHLGEIGEIARGLAHTLRNPLNALGLSLEEIAARVDPGDDAGAGTDRLVASARRQIRRADHSIRSFLALASHGGEVEKVDLAELARDVALEAIQDAGRRVLVEVDAPHPARVSAIAPELRAVLQALVVNAVEASPDDETVAVTVTAVTVGTGATVGVAPDREEAECVRLTVADRGPGLPESVRERLFTPHQTTKVQGSGMGLFLAHRIATTRYGGSLRLDPREGGGTLAVLTVGARQEGGHDHETHDHQTG